MPVLEIAILGSPVVRWQSQEILVTARKSAGLLYYLAAQPLRPFTRAQIVALLWEAHDEAVGRNSLSTALSRLRQVLAVAPSFPIKSTADSLVWEPNSEIQTDLERFVRITEGSGDDPPDLEAAVALYRGEFLEGFEIRDCTGYAEWLTRQRSHWQQQIVATYRQLILRERSRDQRGSAILHIQRALTVDPLQEELHRTLIELYFLSGDRTQALAQFQTCERLLREGLDVSPSAETRALREAIASGRMPPVRPSEIRSPQRETIDVRPTVRSIRTARPHYRLIGRESEVRRLRQSMATTPGHRSRLIVIQGEAGIGKTRLIEEVLSFVSSGSRQLSDMLERRKQPQRWTIFVGHSYQDAQGLPYHPIIEALRAQLVSLDVDSLSVPDIWLAEVNRLLPEVSARRAQHPTPARLDPPQERRRLFEGIAQFLAAIDPSRLFILEDLHWADVETLHLLTYLVRHESLQGTLFLVSLRPEDQTAALEQILTGLEYEGRLERMTLEPLSEAATLRLIQEIAAQDSSEIGGWAYHEGEGNPLFTVELTRSLLESGVRPTDRRPSNLESTAMPATIQAVIRGRLARLDPTSREFLNAAAVFRRTVEFDDVREVAGQTEDVALEALETLLRAQILRETSVPLAADVVTSRYSFGHDQIRRAVYEGLSNARRRLLHRRVLDLHTARGRDDAEQLAYHACRAQDWVAGLDLSEAAATHSLQLWAYDAAVHDYEQALACAYQLPQTPDLRRRIIDLRVSLAQVGFYVQPGRLIEWLAPAEAVAGELNDVPRQSQVWLAQASALYIQGHFTDALSRVEQLQRIAESIDDPSLPARTDNLLGRLLVIRGELSRGLAALERALAAADPASGPIWEATPLDRLASIGLASCAYAFRGQFREALESMERCHQLPVAPTDAAARAAEHFYHALIRHTRGDWPATIAAAEAAIQHARSAANLIYEYVSHVYLGPALAYRGQIADGLRIQQEALAMAERAHTRVILGRAYAWLGEILLLDGQAQSAYEAAQQGETLGREHGHLLEAAMCTRVRGEACVALAAWDEAQNALEDARTHLAMLEAWPEWTRAESAIGRLDQARGDTAGARRHLAEAERRFAEMDMTWDLARVRAAIALLS